MEIKGLQTNFAKKIITLFCITLLTLVILCMACGAFAQNSVYIGPYLGIGNQQSYNANFYNDPSVKVSKIPGASFGASLEDSMTSSFTLGIGLGYSNFSTEATYNVKTTEEGTLTGTYYNNFGYLSAPISFIVKSKTKNYNTIGFYGELQLIPSLNTSAVQKQTADGLPESLTSIKDQTHTLNLMVGAAGGIFIPMNNMIIRIGPYYTTSLVDIQKAYPDYITFSGKTETYTPTMLHAIGANITIAIKINSSKSFQPPVASTSAPK